MSLPQLRPNDARAADPSDVVPTAVAARRSPAWLAARTTNALRRPLLIAGVGSLVMVGAVLTFVLIPRRADRLLADTLAALPPAIDTTSLLTRQRLTRLARDSAAARVATVVALARAGSAAPPPVGGDSGLIGDSTSPMSLARRSRAFRDDTASELRQSLARARQAPLVESYRALAATSALQGNPVVHATLDTIESLNREREAQAALGGPDARYAVITARVGVLGARLERLAESTLAARPQPPDLVEGAAPGAGAGAGAGAGRPSADSAHSASVPPGAIGVAGAAVTGSAGAGRVPGDSGPLLATPFAEPIRADSLATVLLARADSALAHADSALATARASNATLLARRAALREQGQIAIPPGAMLLAALVLGMTLGFAVALFRELRHPTLASATELERLTGARVLTHEADRRGSTDDAFTRLHLTLSSIGEIAAQVQVLADRPLLAGMVATRLAQVAARESRATVLVDLAVGSPALAAMTPSSVARDASRSATMHAHAPSPAWSAMWDATRALRVGRDATIDLVVPWQVSGRHRSRAARTVAERGIAERGIAERGSAHRDPVAANPDESTPMAEAVRPYDLAIFAADEPVPPALPHEADVVLCARVGVTSLAWLIDAVRTLAATGRPVRAAILWVGQLPLAAAPARD